MVTKLKGWTTRLTTKIICFVLAVLTVICCAGGVFHALVYFEQTGVSPDVVFKDENGALSFYNSHIFRVASDADAIIQLESEENILSGGNIRWEVESGYGSDSVWFDADYFGSSWISGEEDTPEYREQLENEAILNQLSVFRSAQSYLDGLEGLYYCIKAGGETYSNTEKDLAFFESLPVYYAAKDNELISSSHSRGLIINGEKYELYAGFDEDVVKAESALEAQARDRYLQCLAVVCAAFAIFVICLVVLLSGAGRRYGDDENRVHLLAIDRPYHDLSLCFVAGLSALVIAGVLVVSEQLYWHTGRFDVILYWVLAGAGVVAALLLYWLSVCAKRIKDKSFFRHTFIFRVLKTARNFLRWALSHLWRLLKILGGAAASAAKRIFNALHDFFMGIWAGTALTAKVVVIIAVVSVTLLIGVALALSYNFGFMLFLYILLIAAASVLLLRYAHRIRALEIGADEVSKGAYDIELDVGGGELGSIAGSINNISAGISAAVEERMKSERLKTELITNVSHDIRTPLTSIITYTDLLKNEGLDCKRAPEYLDVLIAKSERLKTLTDELFEAAKAASGNIEVSLEPINLTQLLQQVFGEADERIKSSGLDFRKSLPESAWVMADGKLLWRVIENLLSNIFKYSLTGSRVYVEVCEDGSYMRLEMKNISRDPLTANPAELTERFKRGDDSRSGEGSGLGLSIVQSFVEAQDGRFVPTIDGDLFKAGVYLPKVIHKKPL